MSKKAVRRLYNQFQPTKYKLKISPDRESMRFSGRVTLYGKKVGRPSQRITLHQSGLTITSCTIVKHDRKTDTDIEIERINQHRRYDEVRLHTDQILYPGYYTIELTFHGTITKAMNGMYPCSFTHDGENKQLIATQFESHHAREVFPCVDEPEAKATFDLTLTTPQGETVLANTPVKKQTTSKTTTTTTFETTPVMSTYLLAFAYGELDYIEAKTKDGVKVRTYATPDNVGFTEFALDVAVKCLEFYNDYFGIDYPLVKCDMIALPDFASGAMENWGLITYREQTLLVDPQNTSLSNKQYVAMVVAHELAHQWFGNLVTMRWWTDLWLNEGFASWIEYMAVDHLFPEWQMWTQFTVDEQQPAFRLDALEYTHPIEVEVKQPDEIRTIFDTISYNKGASVIRMLHQFLGSDNFRDGLRHYLEMHAYGNTDTVDLWDALGSISGKPVKKFMQSWTSQPGFPVVRANVDQDREVSLKQERFYLNPQHTPEAPTTWPIPLLTSDPQIPDKMVDATLSFKLKDSHHLKLNSGQSGFYRTAYNSSHLERLGAEIQSGHLEPNDRLGIISDLFETAKAGQTDTADALEFLRHVHHEDNYAVWDIISGALGNIRLVMNDEQLREAMKPYTRELVSIELERLGWEKQDQDTHFDRLLRPIILGMAASADEPWVVDRCQELFSKLTQPGSSGTYNEIDPDMRGVVFGTVARLGDTKEFEKIMKLHDESTLSEERVTLAAALTGFEKPKLISNALSHITSDKVRLQDVIYWIAYSFMNRHAREQTWQWLQKNWSWLEKHIGTDLSFHRMPIYVARVHSDSSFIPEYKKFFEARMTPALERSYKQGLEVLQWQSAWKTRDLKEIRNFFIQLNQSK
ncbi:MAG: M1 family metallopeptidase [Candidatus Saccharibacteria bacterium]|nr:M1 family metallopeptidase [Candidatus Saccharibacteria bacterium]